MSTYYIIRKAETNAADISICSDGIIRVIFKKNTEINPQVFEELFKKYNEIIEGKKYAYLYTVEEDTVTLTDEGRKYAKKNEHVYPKICNAVAVESLTYRLFANFYLKFNQPNDPYKVFNNICEAENWCYLQLMNSGILN